MSTTKVVQTTTIKCPNQGCVNGACPQCGGTRNPGCSCEGTGTCNTCDGSNEFDANITPHPANLDEALSHAKEHGMDIRFSNIWPIIQKSPHLLRRLHDGLHLDSNQDNNPRDWHVHSGYPVKFDNVLATYVENRLDNDSRFASYRTPYEAIKAMETVDLNKLAQDGGGGDGGSSSGGDSGGSGSPGSDSGGGDSYGGGAPDTGASEGLGEFAPGSGQQGPDKDLEGMTHCPRCGDNCYSVGGYFWSCANCGWTKRKKKKYQRSASWNDVLQKAKRLRSESRVEVVNLQPDVIAGTVVGDHGQYQVELWRQFPGSWSITLWSCSCPWGDWAFKRQKTYIGRLCSHAVAVLHQAHSMEYRKDSEHYRDVSRAASIMEIIKTTASSKKCKTCYDQGIIFDDDDIPMECPECTGKFAESTKYKDDNEEDPLGPYRNIDSPGYSLFDDDDYDTECKDNTCAFADVPHLVSECEEVKRETGAGYSDSYYEDSDAYDIYTWGEVGDSKDKGKGKGKSDYKNWYKEKDPEDYVKGIEPEPKRKGLEWMDYDTRWFNDNTNKDVLDTVEYLTNRYPVTKDWFQGLHVSSDGPVTVPKDKKIFLSPWSLDKPGSPSAYAGGKDEKTNTIQLDWLTAHEFGHVLHISINKHAVGEDKLPNLGIEELRKRQYNDEQMRFPESKATQAIDSAKAKFGDIKKAAPSSYGSTDELEYFAESMSDTWTSEDPHEISTHIADQINKHYDAGADTGPELIKSRRIKPSKGTKGKDGIERDTFGDAIDPVIYNHENGFHDGKPSPHCEDCKNKKKTPRVENQNIVDVEMDPQTGVYAPVDKKKKKKKKGSKGAEEDFMTCDKGHDHWGLFGAAGALYRVKQDDGNHKYLLQLRSAEVQQPLTWSVPGGAIRQNEQPIDGAKRELEEEIGGAPEAFLGGYTVQDHGNWKYHTFIFDVDKEFKPDDSGWETTMTRWVTKNDMDSMRLHPGFQKWKEEHLDGK